jgi:transglutaminase-like putative cysteine protease
MSTAAALPAVRGAQASGPLLPLGFARGAAYVALALFGGLHWVQLTDDPEPRRAVWSVGLGLAVALGLLGVRRLPPLARHVAATVISLAGVALALLAAGVADEMLRPDRWGDLAAGLTRGVEAIPGVRVPYRGLDEWTRITILAGGTLLTVLAAILAFWPRRSTAGLRIASLIALVALYATPAVALVFDGEFRRGALLTVLVLAYLRLERVGIKDAPGAAMLAAGAAVLALMVAPLLDRGQPWWDYETWALSAASARSTTFSWDHEYGPLDWPRDGRELLRVKARLGTYWKADNLDLFDGHRWRHQPLNTRQFDPQLPDDLERIQRWSQEITVTIRNLRSRTFITAGTTDRIDFPRRGEFRSGVAGIFSSPRMLRRGDTYTAFSYTPRAPARDLRQAGTFYDPYLSYYRRVDLPDEGSPQIRSSSGGLESSARVRVDFPSFGSPGQPTFESLRFVGVGGPALDLLEKSPVARSWKLAQSLKVDAETPYDYVRAVERYLSRGFTYTEAPPEEAESLEGFLFDAKAGYCQQYSGAMALLLRMGGVPARVATGFTAGSLDRKNKEYVVRDFDAHSWVEAWFPGWGWIPFDPTPSSAPPRAQAGRDATAIAGIGDVRDLGDGDVLDPRAAAAADEGSGPPWGLIAAAAAAVAILAGLFWRLGAPHLHRHRRARALSPLSELERALRRTGRPPQAGQTLRSLESRLAGPAAGYVRAVREARFGGRATRPTPQQRRALRAELGRGSMAARLRAWWALPPRLH